MIKFAWALLGMLVVSNAAFSQQTFPRNGAYDERPGRYAFTNATIVVDPQTRIEKGTLLIEKGKIVGVGANVNVPKGTVVTDLAGKYIYPSLIELDSDYGMPEVKRERTSRRSGQQLESNKKGAYGWNQAVQPEARAAELFVADAKQAKDWRTYGWGTLLVHPHDGIVRGSGALVTPDDASENRAMLRDRASAHFSLDKGSSSQSYPGSVMGSVALLRQTYYDADWFDKGGKNLETNLSLTAFNQLKALPAFFESDGKLGVLRADKIGDEFGIQYIIRGGGDEYQRLEEVKATKAPLLIPLTFPAAPDVEDPWDADLTSVAELKSWEMAPSNPAALAKAGIAFALTASGLKTKADFWTNLRKAIEFGLTKEKALEAVTLAPARLARADDRLGSLAKGKDASFLITSHELFDEDNRIHENWIQGQKFVINDLDAPDLRGTYALTVGGQTALRMRVTGKPGKPEYEIMQSDSVKFGPKVSVNGEQVTVSYQPDKKNPGTVRLTGWISGRDIQGQGTLPDGMPVEWTAVREAETTSAAQPDTVKTGKPTPTQPTPDDMGPLLYPFVGYGNEKIPQPETILIRNATVWTNESDGILEETDVLVRDGKIARIGKGLSAPAGGRTLDGTGKHLTSGIVDEHSHIALFSVNEGGQTSSAEVRMSDVIDSEDIDIYRQLAGGVTTSQLLHGSANSIGGQSAVIKLKWGMAPADLWIPEARYIKFALGENVKQSNWGDAIRSRFPQTRMGVEQVFYDHFIRAREYDAALKKYQGQRNKNGVTPPRRDLELDALAEILNEERFITCHSYVQSEINMLLNVADSLDFKVNTFTHILEGYKVADKMAAHGAGGSTFSDWWAYKMEVKEAIPYNAALMAKEGVVVAINSDDAEMARRLNQEAAKTVLFGGMPEQEALKMVTLNPAKLLHLDDRIGSIKTGKDADLVLWNDHPLSVYARPDYTMIEGAVFFDYAADQQKQKEIEKEKARLVQKALAAKSKGAATRKPEAKTRARLHCDDIIGVHADERADRH